MRTHGALLEFIGDSITDAGRRFDRAEGLGRGFVRLIQTELSPRGARVVNRGLSGDRVADLRQRWRADCLDLEPDVLTIFIGINDVWRRYDEGDETPLDAFARDYRYLLTTALQSSVGQVVLMEPFLLEAYRGQAAWREDLDPKRAAVAALAKEFQLPLVPLDRIMRERADEVGPAALTTDGIHPTALGHRVIADAWLALVDGA